MPRTSLTITIICLLRFMATCSADVVILNNGDRITGDVVKKDGDALKLKTSYAGTIEITWAEIRRLEMEEPVEILLDDQSVVSGPAIMDRDEGFSSSMDGRSVLGTLDPDRIETINPEPWELGEAGRFTGRLNFATKLENGSVDKDEFDLDVEMTYHRGDYRFRQLGTFEYDRRDGTNVKSDWQSISQYDRFFTEKTYLSLWYGAEQEKFKGLDLRQFAGPAIGRQFYEGKPTRLLSELGIVGVDENFADDPDTSFYGPAWYLDYEQDLFQSKLQFYHKHLAILSAEDTDKALWQSWSGFRYPLYGGLTLSAEFEVDYDSEPTLRAEDTDTTFRLKLGYQW